MHKVTVMFVPRTNLSLQLKKMVAIDQFLAVLEAIENLTLASCKRQQARRQGGARGAHAPPPPGAKKLRLMGS